MWDYSGEVELVLFWLLLTFNCLVWIHNVLAFVRLFTIW